MPKNTGVQVGTLAVSVKKITVNLITVIAMVSLYPANNAFVVMHETGFIA